MISLLDVNILIALFDAAHHRHDDAHNWLAENRSQGWATCPITQNGCIRIISHTGYSGHLAIPDISSRLWNAIHVADHHFFEDSISLCNPDRFHHSEMLSSKALTDHYLLGLAVEKKARLVTFDTGIAPDMVKNALKDRLVVLKKIPEVDSPN
jgi:toxin-antitoxin system PIN domain toxin